METKPHQLSYEDAAHYKTEIVGWVCKTCQRYYGHDAHIARYCCAKDMPCNCGNRRHKHYTVCSECRENLAEKRFLEKEARVWNGRDLLYSEIFDHYFSDLDDLEDAIVCDIFGSLEVPEDWTLSQELVDYYRFIICKPQYGPEIDLEDLLQDYLPEDTDLDCTQINKTVNDWIKSQGILSWIPGKYRWLLKTEG